MVDIWAVLLNQMFSLLAHMLLSLCMVDFLSNLTHCHLEGMWPSWHWHRIWSCHVVDKPGRLSDCRGKRAQM